MKKLVLSALLFVAGSATAFDDTVIAFSDLSSSNNVYGVATASGTEIKTYSGNTPGGIAVGFGGGVYGVPNTNGYLTFDLKSTGNATSIPSFGGYQSFQGDFKITSNADGTGTVYAASSGLALTGTIVGVNGAASFVLDTTSATDLTGTLVTGGQFVGPFGVSLHFASASPTFGLTTISGNTTIKSFSSIVTGSVTGTAVPEPSTFALLGFGVAGLAFATYRQRKVASAV